MTPLSRERRDARTALPPRVLVASGFEPSGRAGLLADLWALAAFRLQPEALVTALTAQGTRFRLEATPAPLLALQLQALLERGPPAAAKLGMVATRAQLSRLEYLLLEDERYAFPIVVDPVVSSSRGQKLSALTPRDYLRLAHPRVVLTPNAEEAGWLLGESVQGPIESGRAREWGRALLAHGFGMVVLKGGHLSGAPVDLVCVAGRVHRLEAQRIPRDPARHRGTGCRFASALAAGLALGHPPRQAALRAQARVHDFLLGSGGRT